ncbi:MAG: peptidase M14 [Candidatus Sumerlaeia bacterium]|nr:peptidase M14 [Candidatus Sumerlaeia bacterium]
MLLRLSLLLLGMLLGAPPALAQHVTSPAEHLGRPIGTDFELADWNEVASYYWRLAEESPRVQTSKIGVSTEGRDFLLTLVSSEENLARIDEWRHHAAVLADPRGRTDAQKRAAVEQGRVILLVSPQMHSTEAAGTEAIMQFAWLLATSDDEPWALARQNLVVGIFPCTNPDGLDHTVHWYREHVGTPLEATGMLQLYQKYTGHDNNRDWFMLTQAETRIVSEQLYTVWRPQVYWDVHQQQQRTERFFVPPFRDPLNPNIDPAVTAGINVIGTRAVLDMTKRGLTGISTGVTYDMWWHGGNRSTPTRHNIIGLLTEAASVDIATPLFLRIADLRPPGALQSYEPSNLFIAPWPGGWWRLRDITEYQLAFGESLVGTLAREREFWLRNSLEIAERIIEQGRQSGPRAWIIPADNRDPDAVRRLLDALLRTGVEVHVAAEALQGDGRSYPAGSVVIQRDQPYAAHVKDLFEVQRYPKGDPPYDVAGWTLPLLMGVHRVEVMEAITADLQRVETAEVATAAFTSRRTAQGLAWSYSTAHSASWTAAFERLSAGNAIELRTSGDHAGMLVDAASESAPGLRVNRLPRIGLYAPWSANMDEGWTRWVFDTWQVPYIAVRNEHLRAGRLHDFLDVLVIPSITQRLLDEGRPMGSIQDEFARGLAPEGAAAVEEFVRTGGRLVALDSACAWTIDLLQLPLVDVTAESKGFSCPGSVLRAIPVAGEALNAGLPDSLALFFSSSSAFRDMTTKEREEARRDKVPVRTLLRYAPSRVLLSGWIEKPESIEGHAAWVHVRHGAGEVHLFGFRPQYRAWSQATFPLLFRAMLFTLPADEKKASE